MEQEKNNKIILYSTEDGKAEIAVSLEGETVWLSQKQMAELFNCSVDNVALHLKNVYLEGELDERSTSEESLVVQKEGSRESYWGQSYWGQLLGLLGSLLGSGTFCLNKIYDIIYLWQEYPATPSAI